MKAKHIITIVLVAILGWMAWRVFTPSDEPRHEAVSGVTNERSSTSSGNSSSVLPAVPSTDGPLVPVAGDWVLIGYNKTRMLSNRENKLQGLAALPGAIIGNRKYDPEGVAAMYDTLIQLVGDPDDEVAVTAALELYGMGDYKGVALKRLGESLKESAKSVELKYEDYYHVLVRTERVLKALEQAKDHRLDDVIYEAWTTQKDREFQLASRIEYAEYLERAGRQLPEDYWAKWGERGLQFARELLRDRYGTKYQPLFEKQAAHGDSWATGLLYEQTQDRNYLTALMRQANEHVDSVLELHGGRDARSLGELCRVAPEMGRPIVERLLAGGDNCASIGVKAITTDQSEDAAEALYAGAMRQWNGNPSDGRHFPRFQLQALAERKSPTAQERYEQLKREILGKPRPPSDNQGPVYTDSDFYPSDILRPGSHP